MNHEHSFKTQLHNLIVEFVEKGLDRTIMDGALIAQPTDQSCCIVHIENHPDREVKRVLGPYASYDEASKTAVNMRKESNDHFWVEVMER